MIVEIKKKSARQKWPFVQYDIYPKIYVNGIIFWHAILIVKFHNEISQFEFKKLNLNYAQFYLQT